MAYDDSTQRTLSPFRLNTAFGLVLLASVLPLVSGWVRYIPPELPPVWRVVFAMLPTQLGMFFAATLPYLLSTRPLSVSWGDLGLGRLAKRDVLRILRLSPLLFFAVMMVSTALTWIAKLCGVADPDQPLIRLALSADTPTFCVIAVSAVLIAPVTEELAFRRTAFEAFRRFLPLQTAAVMASLIFALIHAALWQTPALFLLAFLFQQEYIRSGNRTTSTILMHAIYNFITVLCLLAMRIHGGGI